MIGRRRPPFTRLRADERGVTLIEFALFAPIIAFMIVGITDLARGFSTKLTLEQAVYRGLEKAAVGTVETDYTYLKAEVAAAAGVPATSVTVDQWLECDGARQPLFEGSCESGQMVSRYLELTVAGKFQPTFDYSPFGADLFNVGTDGTVAMTANAAVRLQ